ncbi:MAG: hypothetical protein ABIU54_02380 [Candidatus Eisenbacteria bacterium]
MNRFATRMIVLLVAFVALAASTGVSSAALRAPQVAVLGGSLQAYFSSIGETINVNTQQDAAQTWTRTISTNSAVSLLIEQTPSAGVNTIGLYNGSAAVPTLYPVLPGAAAPGWFAQVSFRISPDRVVVNLFDNNALPVSSNTYFGIDATNFGFYISGPNGTFYQQDARNPGAKAQLLSYAGSGVNAGTWFLAFEEAAVALGSDQDFDDSVVQVESMNPTPVSSTTWGSLKSRFR